MIRQVIKIRSIVCGDGAIVAIVQGLGIWKQALVWWILV
jgi:hypothetical protein